MIPEGGKSWKGCESLDSGFCPQKSLWRNAFVRASWLSRDSSGVTWADTLWKQHFLDFQRFLYCSPFLLCQRVVDKLFSPKYSFFPFLVTHLISFRHLDSPPVPWVSDKAGPIPGIHATHTCLMSVLCTPGHNDWFRPEHMTLVRGLKLGTTEVALGLS